MIRLRRGGCFFHAAGAVVAAAVIAISPLSSASAQETRDALFTQMMAAPGDLDAMLAYARAAASDRDYEAAVGTLERVLDADPANQDARLDLARAYYALGALGPAQYHLNLYLERGTLTATERDTAEAYVRASAQRDADLSLSGSLQFGLAYRADEGDTGIAYGADFVMRQDLGAAVTHRWDTELRLRGYYLPEDETESRARLVLRTGPSFAIDGTALGPRLRPFLAVESVVDTDLVDEGTAVTAGLAYDNPVSRHFGVFASLEAGRLWRDDADDADRLRGLIGVTWRPHPDLDIRLSGRRTLEDTGDADLTRDSGRIDITWRFEPGLGDGTRPWIIGAFGQADQEDYSGGREDDLTAYGARLRGYWTRDFFTELSVSRLERDSSTDSFDDDETLFALTIGKVF